MVYMGSKRRVASDIVKFIRHIRNAEKITLCYEPFSGGFNMSKRLSGFDKVIFNDKNKYVVSLMAKLVDGWQPPHNVSKEFYYKIRQKRNLYPKHLVAYVGLCCSFSGKWFSGYAGVITNQEGELRDYQRPKRKAALVTAKGVALIPNHEFRIGDYDAVLLVDGRYIIYADAPYSNMTGYKGSEEKFDFPRYYEWLRAKVAEGHIVLVSEYSMPADFLSVWDKKLATGMKTFRTSGGGEKHEHLFMHESQVHLLQGMEN